MGFFFSQLNEWCLCYRPAAARFPSTDGNRDRPFPESVIRLCKAPREDADHRRTHELRGHRAGDDVQQTKAVRNFQRQLEQFLPAGRILCDR